MTDNTKPEALDLADWLEAVGGGPSAKRCAALLREQHARIAELESELEAVGAGGVQALSAAPEAIAKLRHLYQNMVNGAVRDTASAKRIAEGLLAPAIEALERATPPAEQPQPHYSHLHDADAVHGKRLSVYSKPTAEQQAITPETGNSVSAQGAAITSESGTPQAEHQAEESYVKLLAECRDAFPIPEPGGPLEVQWAAAMARPDEVPEYVRLCVAAMQAAPKAAPRDGWLQSGALLYRLTDDRRPCNRDEIHVTMADGSRTPEACARRAGELLDRIRAAPQQEPYAYAVYFPDQPKVELVHDLDELIDDLTNRQHTVTKLYTAPQPAPAPMGDDLLEALQEIVEDLEQGAIPNANDPWWRKAAGAITTALAAQGGKT